MNLIYIIRVTLLSWLSIIRHIDNIRVLDHPGLAIHWVERN